MLARLVILSISCIGLASFAAKPVVRFIDQETIQKAVVVKDSVPAMFRGNFMDDYGIRYSITESLWTQHKGINYHIIKWDTKDQFLIARNDPNNPSEAGLYTRIDFMPFENMTPFLWGFCLTVYNAKDDQEAENTAKADRQHPKTGCNGFPFSRMKRIE